MTSANFFRLFIFAASIFVHTQSSAQSQIITTIAGVPGGYGDSGDGGMADTAKFKAPYSIVFDAAGNLYIGDASNHRVRKVNASGIISAFAGNGSTTYSGDDGPATTAGVPGSHLYVDAAGNIYITGVNVRKVNASGIITRVAGAPSGGTSGDGVPATGAFLYVPGNIAIDAVGNIYIAETNRNCIRMVNTAGIISTVVSSSTLAGYSGDGGPATAAQLRNPTDVTFDVSGNMYITDYGNHCIRKVTAAGIISTVAGNGTPGFSGDGGPAISAQLHNPYNVSFDPSGNMYISDYGNSRIRCVNTSGIITTVAGNGSPICTGDGGLATAAGMTPFCVKYYNGKIYIADASGNCIRQVGPGTPVAVAANAGTEKITVYPNPATSDLFIKKQGPLKNTAIFDITGKCVFRRSYNSAEAHIDISFLAKGEYVITADGATYKFIKD